MKTHTLLLQVMGKKHLLLIQSKKIKTNHYKQLLQSSL